MENVQEKKQIEDLTAVEAVAELKAIFENIQNPFNGSVSQVKANLKGVEILFEKVNKALIEE